MALSLFSLYMSQRVYPCRNDVYSLYTTGPPAKFPHTDSISSLLNWGEPGRSRVAEPESDKHDGWLLKRQYNTPCRGVEVWLFKHLSAPPIQELRAGGAQVDFFHANAHI